MNNTEKEIITSVIKHKKRLCTNYECAVPNCYTSFDNEADILLLRSSGFCDEIEIKVSRSDLLVDKKKRVHYRDCEQGEWNWEKQGLPFAPYTKEKHVALLDGNMTCNYFWYAVKEGICDIADIPQFAGFIVVNEKGEARVVRQATRLHRNKLTDAERYKIARKLSFRFWRTEYGVPF